MKNPSLFFFNTILLMVEIIEKMEISSNLINAHSEAKCKSKTGQFMES